MKPVFAVCGRVYAACLARKRAMGQALGALVVAASLTLQASATEPDPLLPDTGVDIVALVGEGVTKLGTYLIVIVAAYIAFLLVKKSMSWARRAF